MKSQTLAALEGCVGAVADAPEHDPNLVAFLSDIHLLDNTVRWKNGPTQSSVVLPQLVAEILALRPRPKNWQERVRMHDGRKVTFWYDKPVNFYKA